MLDFDHEGAGDIERAWREGITPDPFLTVSEWADAHRVLSSKSASEPGRWRTSRTPYLKAIMDCLSPTSPVERVVLMKGGQVGGTECGNNWIGYVIHHAPGPMMAVAPTVEMAKRNSKQRIDPLIEQSPALAGLVAPHRSRDSGNTILTKEFRGGVLVMTGANSAVGLRSMPVRYLFLDEVDGYPGDVEGEGDAVNLACARTRTFARRKIFIVSTPTLAGTSSIEREFEASDQRRYFVPCPTCGEMQVLKWSQIQWPEGQPEMACYVCEHCGTRITDAGKPRMLSQGEWRATVAFRGVAGFHLNELYSPWRSFSEIARDFISAQRSPETLKTWVNTSLGETWEEDGEHPLSHELMQRAEDYPLGVVPEGGLLLTAGVDVQGDRLEVSVHAWGPGEECWLVDWQQIYGDPARNEPWSALDSLREKPYPHACGGRLRIASMAIDTGGHHTHEVYAYCRSRRNVIAIKGQNRPGKPILGRPTDQDVNWRGKTIKRGVKLWPVGADTAKALLYGRLTLAAPGPGYIHFSAGLPADYYDQLTAEKLVTRFHKGFARREWVKQSGARNEALDCFVYAYAAALQAGMGRLDWQRLERAVISQETQPMVVQEINRATVRTHDYWKSFDKDRLRNWLARDP